MSDKSVKEMANLLRNGATMLNLYCPKCNGILFKLKNQEIFCPNCNRNVKIVKSQDEYSSISDPSLTNQKENVLNDHSDLQNSSETFFDLNNRFSLLIQKLTKMLENVSDLSHIEKILDNIDKTLNIIIKLREMRGLN